MANHALKPSSVIFAKNVETMTDFYRAVFSMTEIGRDDLHIVLDAPGFQVVIHSIPEAIAQSIEITQPPEMRQMTPLKLCLPVESIADAREIAATLGGGINSPSEEWTSTSFQACDGYDLEGNIIQVREKI